MYEDQDTVTDPNEHLIWRVYVSVPLHGMDLIVLLVTSSLEVAYEVILQCCDLCATFVLKRAREKSSHLHQHVIEKCKTKKTLSPPYGIPWSL